ncbi:hypothetical protein IscW_ISCW001696 [Ixodes scapularis]|uniref:Uncharacterized protein n=1 Tax=Ixodes scapularis TaxID=6945 RepID=B7P2L7_IXOSC|nr:hypothetical protein IscW_ISCW001696 [Ixodes scapularis]|eukprot:XP_002402561.1 hypothetical protein IscW_ISCW001696 [Ixodes scapularis]
MEEDSLLVRWLKRGMYIIRMLLGYSVPLMCVSLVKNKVYSKTTRSLFVMIVCYVQLLLGTVHWAVGSFLVFVYLPFLELETMPNLSLNYFTVSTAARWANHIGISEELADELWKLERVRKTCLIGVGFSCTLGGMGFMSGHLINYYLKGIIEGYDQPY